MQMLELIHIFDTEGYHWLDSLQRQCIFHVLISTYEKHLENALVEHNLHFAKHKVQK